MDDQGRQLVLLALRALELDDQLGAGLRQDAERGLGVSHVLLDAPALVDRVRVDQDPVDQRIVEQVLRDRLDEPPAAILVEMAVAPACLRPGALQDRLEGSGNVGDVVGVNEREGLVAHLFVRLVAEHALDGRALVANDAFGIEDRQRFDRAVDQGLEVAVRIDRHVHVDAADRRQDLVLGRARAMLLLEPHPVT